tara:strand:- start:113 stop:487 length:375 start_codon:yes stop_codon:yes gene_type:complete
MATATTASISTPIGDTLFTVTETETKPSPVALDASGGTLYAVEIDNTANSAVAYLHMWNIVVGSVTIGDTDEHFTFMAPANSRITYACPEGSVYGTALTAGVVSSPGGSVGPSATVIAYVLIGA